MARTDYNGRGVARCAVATCMTMLMSTSAHAQSPAELPAAADSTIYSEANNLSNGAGPRMTAGHTANQNDNDRRALIRFDLSSIPAGSTITSVQLRLFCVRLSAGAPHPARLHRLTSDWGEGMSSVDDGQGALAQNLDATWEYTFFNQADPPSSPTWGTMGGDFVSTVSAEVSAGNENQFYTWGSTPQMVADVQAWLDDPSSNFGWMIRGDETSTKTATHWSTKESTLSGGLVAPLLTVEYTEAPACCLGDANGSGTVDFGDVQDVIVNWLTAGPIGDADCNGLVDFSDVQTIVIWWLNPCPNP